MTPNNAEIQRAYNWCLQLAKSHYENFPVASVLLPKRLRHPVAAIYAFARSADDFADEGNAPKAARLAQLDHYSVLLQQIDGTRYQGTDPIFIALQDTVQRFSLPVQLLEDLLIAFRQDVTKNRYANFAEVLDYCRYSANPVGRLVLHLQGQPSDDQLSQSDAICSALQLINFYQDIVQDLAEQDRIYLPQDMLTKAGLTETDLLMAETTKLAPVLRKLYQKTVMLMQSGIPLGASISGRLGWEIRAMTLGGIMMLFKLRQQSNRALITRPRLSRRQLLWVLCLASSKRHYLKTAHRFS